MTENKKRSLVGYVKSDKMEKTIVVEVRRRVMEQRYKKYIQRSSKYHAHDENNECKIGDKVEIMESKPISKNKRWIMTQVIEKAVEV